MTINGAVIDGAAINGDPEALPTTSTVLANAIARYTCVLEGSPDLALPVSSISARMTDGQEGSITVVVPNGAGYIDGINARQGNDIVITETQTTPAGTVTTTECLRAAFEELRVDSGARSYSITLTARVTVFAGISYRRPVRGVSYLSVSPSGSRRLRCTVDAAFRPGDEVDYGGDAWVVSSVVYSISTTLAQMELGE